MIHRKAGIHDGVSRQHVVQSRLQNREAGPDCLGVISFTNKLLYVPSYSGRCHAGTLSSNDPI